MAQFWKGGGLEAPSQIPRKTSRARFLKESNPEVYWDTSMGPIPCFVQKLGYTSHAPRKKPLLSKGQRVAVFLSFFFLYEILVLWSDETAFDIVCNHESHVYRGKGMIMTMCITQ